jgi:hypothetical protein
MGMWVLDSEDADIMATLDHHQPTLPASPSGEDEGIEPPGTRLARLKALSLVLKYEETMLEEVK